MSSRQSLRVLKVNSAAGKPRRTQTTNKRLTTCFLQTKALGAVRIPCAGSITYTCTTRWPGMRRLLPVDELHLPSAPRGKHRTTFTYLVAPFGPPVARGPPREERFPDDSCLSRRALLKAMGLRQFQQLHYRKLHGRFTRERRGM